MQAQIFVNVVDLPWLDGQNVKPGEEAKTGGKVLKYSVVMESALIVETSWCNLFGMRESIDCSLVGHKHMAGGDHVACLDE